MSVRYASGYALRSYPLGEADLIVELFTREHGRVRAVAKSARRLKSRFGSAFEPFTRSRISWYQRDKDDLGRVSSTDIERSYYESLGTPESAGLAAYMAELLIGLTAEHDPSPPVYRLVDATLEGLADGVDADLLARYFETWLLRLSGLYPDPRTCGSCGRSIERQAWIGDVGLEFLCGRHCGASIGRRRLTAAADRLLNRIQRDRPQIVAAAMAGEATAVADLGGVNEVLICGHLDRVPRSLRVLRQLRAQRSGAASG